MEYQDQIVTRRKMRMIQLAGMNINARVVIDRRTVYDTVVLLRPKPVRQPRLRRYASFRSLGTPDDISDSESVASVSSVGTVARSERNFAVPKSILKKPKDKPFTMIGLKRTLRSKSLPQLSLSLPLQPLPTETNLTEPVELPSQSIEKPSDGNTDGAKEKTDAEKENIPHDPTK
ncbi:uncharacterized protein LOC129580558 [Sitodiplosis mosellana]|uniref:uncharacterized protein LOC129580558 n=1 Tax=Sitodiplosis mosellana TaxID=263140 RepID=UPI002444932C|nr:uncharacterized protein LOC129580558 [Sitodiplosis mosellana]